MARYLFPEELNILPQNKQSKVISLSSKKYSIIAEKLGIYGISDYIDIYDHLMLNVVCITNDGKRDQEFLVNTLRGKLERMRLQQGDS